MGLIPGLIREAITFGPQPQRNIGGPNGHSLLVLLDGTDLELSVSYDDLRGVIAGERRSFRSADVRYDERRGWWEIVEPDSDGMPVLIPHSAVSRVLPLTDAVRDARDARDLSADGDDELHGLPEPDDATERDSR